MRNLNALGVSISNCSDCDIFKKRIIDYFKKFNINICFNEIFYDIQPEESLKFCLENNIDDIPVYIINGIIFSKLFSESCVKDVINRL